MRALSRRGPWIRAVLPAPGWHADLTLEVVAGPPTPNRGQVLVAVEACGICHRDLIDRDGRFPFMRTPITPGHEAVGRVVAVGPEVDEWAVGDRVATMHRDFCGDCEQCRSGQGSLCQRAAHVFGLTANGGYATHLIAPQRALYAMDDEVGAPLAAVMHCTYGTAWRGLHAPGPLPENAPVLVTGANGGVGLAAVELAARLGARVTAVVRDPVHEDLLMARGAERVLVDPDNRFHKPLGPVMDRALDCVGHATFNACLRSLRVGGTAIAIGNIDPTRVELNLGYVITRGLRIIGSSGATRDDMAAVLALHRVTPLRDDRIPPLPLADADAGQRSLRNENVQGRLVLSMLDRNANEGNG